ncbi:uncharacterized protein LOC124151569 isoform X2 [Haliotis rufescens]|uniref:uncharacterized protein LOC124151569 isoform X2 n=1 Tax=Haliotis rufescens TaxID=6454 RepID=UPI00201F5903|nr:uncharacterized protein LOC124151569 isoform X2 [Haliotis rufescens]
MTDKTQGCDGLNTGTIYTIRDYTYLRSSVPVKASGSFPRTRLAWVTINYTHSGQRTPVLTRFTDCLPHNGCTGVLNWMKKMERLPGSIKLTGMSGGQATYSNVAAVVEGGMGNTYHGPQHKVEKTYHNNVSGSTGVTTVNEVTGDTVNIGSSSSSPSQQPASQTASQSPALELMTVEDVQDLMTRERFPETTRKTFEENGIDGKYFVKLLEVGVLEELGVTSPLAKMKIKTILENRSKKSS